MFLVQLKEAQDIRSTAETYRKDTERELDSLREELNEELVATKNARKEAEEMTAKAKEIFLRARDTKTELEHQRRSESREGEDEPQKGEDEPQKGKDESREGGDDSR